MNPSVEPMPTAASPLSPLWRRMLWVVYGVFGLWCAVSLHADFAKIDVTLLGAHAGLVALAGLLPWCNHALRVVRWRMYLAAVGVRFSWGYTALTYVSGFAFTISPGKIGEMVRARYYVQRGVASTTIHGAFFVERLMDLLVMIVLAAMVLSQLDRYQFFVWLALALVLGLLAMVVLLPWARLHERAQQAGAKGGFAASLVSGLAGTFARAKDFITPGLIVKGFALSMLSWGLETVGFKVLLDALSGQELPWASAAGIYAIAIIVGALSFLPGGLGSTEAVLVALLVLSGVALPQALLVTIVWRFLTLWSAVAVGWGCVAWLGRREH